ncbi:DNA-directed RNA polymerase subunit beta [Metabacillus herbersteinensis]|uniref:DNA-directed RNA polymerase subunit beta n=1 Tax=Metabacillus herbersteinensis TaxID=283816 RepID=A0ABV6GFM1_9BACI
MAAKEMTKKLTTREEIKKSKKEHKAKDRSTDTKGRGKIRIRLLPIWLRLILVLLFMILSAVLGLIIGYGVIGEGEPRDALNKSTWQHIVDLVEKEKEE